MFYDARRNEHGLAVDPFKAIVAPRPIGWISSLSADGIANLWYVLGDPALRGKGAMSEALRLICAGNPAGLHVLTAWVGAPNRASQRCLEKAGFARIGRIAGAFAVDGRHDRLLYERVLAG